jgi:hypothetical protein
MKPWDIVEKRRGLQYLKWGRGNKRGQDFTFKHYISVSERGNEAVVQLQGVNARC